MENAPPATAPDPFESASLLPPVLRAPLALVWLWVLPIMVLLALNFQSYRLLAGDMTEGQRSQCFLLGLAGGANAFAGLILYVAALRTPTTRTAWPQRFWWWGVVAVVGQVAYLWYAVACIEDVVPWSWIYSPDRFLYAQFTFAMLPLFWGIMLVAGVRLSPSFTRSLGINVAMAIGAPVVLFVLANSLHFFGHGTGRAAVVVYVTLLVLLAVTMFVGVVGALLHGLRGLLRWEGRLERAAIVLFAAILPVCGLLLNRDIPFPVNFQATEVYVLTLANAAILLFASFQAARRPAISSGLLWITFPFSLYFFIVFLPYTPLSILAVVALGAGFLVLTPTFLFVLHLHLLNQARRSPLYEAGRGRRAMIAALSFAVLPAFFTLRGLSDKAALHAALDYVYAPVIEGGTAAFPSNLPNLQRAIRSHRAYKDGIYYPLLSDYYSWLVFDGLVLPDEKLSRIERIFLGEVEAKRSRDLVRSSAPFGQDGVRRRSSQGRAAPMPRTVEVADLAAKVQPAGEENSTVTLTLTLRNRGKAPAEYVQPLPLPAGACVTGFRLSVNGTLEPGRIFEKKTALWVYAMIRDSERRDPGILYYDTPDELGLKVSPVAVDGGKPSVVEIDLLVPTRLTAVDALTRTRDPAQAFRELGRMLAPRVAHGQGGAVLGGLQIQALPGVEREPYLHVIVDRSATNAFEGDLGTTLKSLREKFPAARAARISLANFEVRDEVGTLTSLDELIAHPPSAYRDNLPAAGGLFLDLAVARAIRTHVALDLDAVTPASPPPRRPIFVVVSKRAAARTFEAMLTEAWSEALPGLDLVEWGADGTYRVHHAAEPAGAPLLRLGHSMRPALPGRVVRFLPTTERVPPEYYSPSAGEWRPVEGARWLPEDSPWAKAMALQLRNADYLRAVAGSGTDLPTLVATSRATGLLLPATSYIVVERSAQWRMLELSEQTKLGQNTALNFKETPAPPSLYVGLAFGLWLARRWWIRRRVPAPA